jgi:hypothetical protein
MNTIERYLENAYANRGAFGEELVRESLVAELLWDTNMSQEAHA